MGQGSLTSKSYGRDGGGVFVQGLQQAVLPLSIQHVDQPVPARCRQQLQTWEGEEKRREREWRERRRERGEFKGEREKKGAEEKEGG